MTSQVELRAMDGGAKPGRGTACVEPSSHRGSGACVLKTMASLSKESHVVWLLPCSSLNAVAFFRQIYRPLNICVSHLNFAKCLLAWSSPSLGGGEDQGCPDPAGGSCSYPLSLLMASDGHQLLWWAWAPCPDLHVWQNYSRPFFL